MPNGTYIDMCSRLPLVDPEKIAVPTIVLRGEYDGIAGFEDLTRFFEKLQRGQAVLRHGRHLAREFPAEELHAGLLSPRQLLRPAGAAVQGGVRASTPHLRSKEHQ